MIKVIKLLEKRISTLNNEIIKLENIKDEPELLLDYEFAINSIGNIELEIIELTKAIKILNQNI